MSIRKAILGALAVALLAAVVPPILFGDAPKFDDRSGGDAWRNTIYDFQTLFTGLAAVAAAAMTILVMERTDARQEERHRELVQLSLRADRLRISRAVHPQLDELPYFFEDIDQLCHAFTGDPSKIRKSIYDDPPQYARIIKNLLVFMNRTDFREARPLFDGDTAYAYDRIIDASEHLDKLWGGYEQQIRNQLRDQRTEAEILDWLLQDALITRRFLETLVEHLEGFYTGLRGLADEYKV
ncbi:hypothetical protein [Sinorhizobium medicae]|uniref:hypothetical protein n=1 Tax=Sinorhizobium medicae TaxID=110321 RepID=UPI000FDC92BF|nr:hypothetical protein [Sinorhizobium medicae]RVJ75110.1 hypothetical protein CN168_23385 [Sinorhizobium medicae]